MNEIQLVYARSIVSPQGEYTVQALEFAVLVKNLAFAKHVGVHWAGDDNVWQVLPASYSCPSGRGRELWQAKTSCCPLAGQLPGKIRFALRYLVEGHEYWDNNRNRDYCLTPSAGLLPGPGVLLAHIGYNPVFSPGGTGLSVAVAVHRSVRAKRVFVRWTTDNWQTYHQSPCALQRNGVDPAVKKSKNNSAKSVHFSVPQNMVIWSCRIKTRKGFRVQYAIGCKTETREIWDNNLGINYTAGHAGLKVLTLNLHCYQESEQDDKFNEIVRAIREVDIDIICLQEVGEEWQDGRGNWPSNGAGIIQDRLHRHGRSYHLYTDWSHIGFDRFREGSAILSRYPLVQRDAAYVSAETDIHSIHARKVVMARIDVPGVGPVHVFSVHLSWWQDGFRPQFEKLRQWADGVESAGVAATLLCGDFNTRAGSRGYMLIAGDKVYEDQFLQIASPAVFARVFRTTVPGREEWLAGDNRIDYIFAKKNSKLKPTSARVLFSGGDYRRVSDHPGYLVEFVPNGAVVKG